VNRDRAARPALWSSPGVVKTPLWSTMPKADREVFYRQMEQNLLASRCLTTAQRDAFGLTSLIHNYSFCNTCPGQAQPLAAMRAITVVVKIDRVVTAPGVVRMVTPAAARGRSYALPV
jgi:hypothetical protein